MPRLFALDHNFPQPIVEVLAEFQQSADLVPIGAIHDRMPDLDDWQVLLALAKHQRPFDGLVTTDSSMLSLPRELSVLMQTRLTLVVAMEAGHNPVKATGLLFAYLDGICQRTRSRTAQIWKLAAANRPPRNPWEILSDAARHQNRDPRELYEASKLSDADLEIDPLAET
jgi:hypothetical protein